MDEFKNGSGDRVRNSRASTSRLLAAFLAFLVLACLAMMLWWWTSRNPSEKPLTPAPNQPYQDSSAIISQRVEAISGVEAADVLILNRTALIALDLETGLTSREIKAVKKEASAAAKDIKDVDEVLVTAHPDLVEEVRAILNGEMPLDRLESIYEKIRDQRL